ncbi:MAG: 50S ribosomal protein L6 [Chloroflexota bacterium]|nr:50S ribosomal protein L6 [Chloroflexota bacterium]
MSRVGRMPIPLPEGVRVEIEGNRVTLTGPRGTLTREFHPDMEIIREDTELRVSRPTDQRRHRELHGLTRALLSNMVIGVTEGYERKLEIQGVGYRVELLGNGTLDLQLGFSHPVRISPSEGIEFDVQPRKKIITVRGVSKEKVGQIAAEIRAWRPPEPYQGKGVRYLGEHVPRKAGKAGKIGAGTY